jgi:hypothetical protein
VTVAAIRSDLIKAWSTKQHSRDSAVVAPGADTLGYPDPANFLCDTRANGHPLDRADLAAKDTKPKGFIP